MVFLFGSGVLSFWVAPTDNWLKKQTEEHVDVRNRPRQRYIIHQSTHSFLTKQCFWPVFVPEQIEYCVPTHIPSSNCRETLNRQQVSMRPFYCMHFFTRTEHSILVLFVLMSNQIEMQTPNSLVHRLRGESLQGMNKTPDETNTRDLDWNPIGQFSSYMRQKSQP